MSYLSYLKETFERNFIEKKYREFNKKYFNGELQYYPIEFTRSKTYGARVLSFGIRNDPSTWEIKKIQFSTMVEYTEADMIGLILHEMIHVMLIEQGRADKKEHGYNFMQALKEMRSKTKIDIPLTDDISNKKVAKQTATQKDYIVVMLNGSGNTKHSINVFGIKQKDSIVSALSEFPSAWLDSNKPVVMISNATDLEKYPIKRKLSLKSYGGSYPIDDVFATIIKKGEIIHKF